MKATEVAVSTRALNIIYANKTQPNLRHLTSGEDLPYFKQVRSLT